MAEAVPPPRPFRIFDVDDRFRSMAVRRGGVTRDDALRRADEQVAQATPQFNSWLDDDISALAQAVGTAADAEAFWANEAIERAANIRDIAKTLRFDVLSAIAGALVAVLEAAEPARETRIEALERHVQAIMLARRRTQLGLPSDRMNEVDASLNRVIEKSRSS